MMKNVLFKINEESFVYSSRICRALQAENIYNNVIIDKPKKPCNNEALNPIFDTIDAPKRAPTIWNMYKTARS